MSETHESRNAPKGVPDDEIELAAYNVLVSSGNLLPQTDAEIAALEAYIEDHPVELPARLREPPSLASCDTSSLKIHRTTLQTGPSKDNLARAARNGAHLPEEVQNRMRADRDAARKKIEESRGNGSTNSQ
jgi:hypothetical protein